MKRFLLAVTAEGGLLPLADGSFVYRQQWVKVSFESGSDGRVAIMRYGDFRATKETSR